VTDSERDRVAMEAALDAGPWDTLRALADWEEEHGGPATAAGYRWLAGLKKFPAGDRGLWFWMGPRIHWSDGLPAALVPASPGSANARLPMPVISGFREVIGRQKGEFDTISQSYRAAAVAIGRWLKEGGGS
jgi:hypothetical protein